MLENTANKLVKTIKSKPIKFDAYNFIKEKFLLLRLVVAKLQT